MVSASLARCPAFTVQASLAGRRAARRLQRVALPVVLASEQGAGAEVQKLAAAAALAAFLSFAGPSFAELDTDTSKRGLASTIEYSQIGNQSAADVVATLKDKILPEVEAKLAKDASRSGSSYPDSIVQELKTVRSEIVALEDQLKAGGPSSDSNVKSAASGIEQQINAMKAILDFD